MGPPGIICPDRARRLLVDVLVPVRLLLLRLLDLPLRLLDLVVALHGVLSGGHRRALSLGHTLGHSGLLLGLLGAGGELRPGRFVELSVVLGEQAVELAELAQPDHAATLHRRVAQLAEERLDDPALAIASHASVVELAPTNESLDALARLHLARNEPADAAQWLERRLETTGDAERVAVRLKLARAHIRSEKRDAAISALQTAFEEAPRNGEVRKLLLGLYRAGKEWEALADTLTIAADHALDDATVLAYAREAADIYHNRLGVPERSVKVLRKGSPLAEDDRELRSMLAEGLRAAGELDDARTLLEALIADFGRRRSPERAAIHLQLARVHRALNNVDEAIDQLETASKMDASNVSILSALAELASEAGQLDRAERAYRTLVITVRRADDPSQLAIGPSEVLLELSHIANARGQHDKATELIESSLESLTQHDFEADRIQAKLKKREQHDLLLRVLDKRLGHVEQAHKRAAIFAARADVLVICERPDEALTACLESIKSDPGSPPLHEAARELAKSMGALERYVAEVETLLSDERTDNSAHIRCELLLRLGEVLERERNDYERAAALYAQAESTGVRQVDVWRAEARVAGARGDEAEQVRLLGLLASLGEDQAETRADASYRLAGVQLASEATRAEGVAALERALDVAFRAERAGLLLRSSSEQFPHDLDLLDVYERVARRSGDDDILLHYLAQRAHHPDATPEHAREAVDAAQRLERDDEIEQLMLRAAEIGRGSFGMEKVDWALLGLAEVRMKSGDIAGAVKWLGEAAEVAEPSQVFALGRQVAELASAPGGDLTLAAKLYERLVEGDPTARDAWEPLAQIYAQLGDVARLERMVEETLDGLQEPADRNTLRVCLARAFLSTDAHTARAVFSGQKGQLCQDMQHIGAMVADKHDQQTALAFEIRQGNALSVDGVGQFKVRCCRTQGQHRGWFGRIGSRLWMDKVCTNQQVV